ncbi:ABC transporter ATP-binding protein [Sphingomonas mesophila]|uniref:ABC transporter ATP-binding protein n=1 Tax=Sphingomonas mesophila TaxID=2303576 RepID=UPI000E56EC9E|nr:ABC transporter ATP-binding protein [Sphingomonas mesophila]
MARSSIRTLRVLRRLGRDADPRFDRRLTLLAVYALVAALCELVTLGSLIPLLAILATGRAPDPPVIGALLPDTALGMVAMFAALVMLTAAVRLALAAASQRGVLAIGHAINVAVQRRLLGQPYAFHAATHSSRFVAALQTVDQLTFGLLRPLVQGTAGLIIGAAIFAFLVAAIGWPITLGALLTLGAAYWLVARFAGRRLAERGAIALDSYEEQVRVMMEGSGAIRDVLLDHRQALFADAFGRASARMARARAGTDLLSLAPRFVVEALGASALAALAALVAARDGGLAASLPLFGLLTLALVRAIPLAQMAYSAWTRLASSGQAVDEIAALLALPGAAGTSTGATPLPFTDRVEVRDLAFAYGPDQPTVLCGADFTIAAGEWVGLTGPTGSGKSTAGDLLMGLLQPTAGTILVDGAALDAATLPRWQRAIGHVSQSVYLIDDSIDANITLAPAVDGAARAVERDGIASDSAEADRIRVADCASIAQLDEWLATLPDGLDTRVGERGKRLSGGQRQRIAIARALYKDARLLILDEATNALDSATETALLAALRRERPDLTVLLISHRASTLACCDRLLTVAGGRIVPG